MNFPIEQNYKAFQSEWFDELKTRLLGSHYTISNQSTILYIKGILKFLQQDQFPSFFYLMKDSFDLLNNLISLIKSVKQSENLIDLFHKYLSQPQCRIKMFRDKCQLSSLSDFIFLLYLFGWQLRKLNYERNLTQFLKRFRVKLDIGIFVGNEFRIEYIYIIKEIQYLLQEKLCSQEYIAFLSKNKGFLKHINKIELLNAKQIRGDYLQLLQYFEQESIHSLISLIYPQIELSSNQNQLSQETIDVYHELYPVKRLFNYQVSQIKPKLSKLLFKGISSQNIQIFCSLEKKQKQIVMQFIKENLFNKQIQLQENVIEKCLDNFLLYLTYIDIISKTKLQKFNKNYQLIQYYHNYLENNQLSIKNLGFNNENKIIVIQTRPKDNDISVYQIQQLKIFKQTINISKQFLREDREQTKEQFGKIFKEFSPNKIILDIIHQHSIQILNVIQQINYQLANNTVQIIIHYQKEIHKLINKINSNQSIQQLIALYFYPQILLPYIFQQNKINSKRAFFIKCLCAQQILSSIKRRKIKLKKINKEFKADFIEIFQLEKYQQPNESVSDKCYLKIIRNVFKTQLEKFQQTFSYDLQQLQENQYKGFSHISNIHSKLEPLISQQSQTEQLQKNLFIIEYLKWFFAAKNYFQNFKQIDAQEMNKIFWFQMSLFQKQLLQYNSIKIRVTKISNEQIEGLFKNLINIKIIKQNCFDWKTRFLRQFFSLNEKIYVQINSYSFEDFSIQGQTLFSHLYKEYLFIKQNKVFYDLFIIANKNFIFNDEQDKTNKIYTKKKRNFDCFWIKNNQFFNLSLVQAQQLLSQKNHEFIFIPAAWQEKNQLQCLISLQRNDISNSLPIYYQTSQQISLLKDNYILEDNSGISDNLVFSFDLEYSFDTFEQLVCYVNKQLPYYQQLFNKESYFDYNNVAMLQRLKQQHQIIFYRQNCLTLKFLCLLKIDSNLPVKQIPIELCEGFKINGQFFNSLVSVQQYALINIEELYSYGQQFMDDIIYNQVSYYVIESDDDKYDNIKSVQQKQNYNTENDFDLFQMYQNEEEIYQENQLNYSHLNIIESYQEQKTVLNQQKIQQNKQNQRTWNQHNLSQQWLQEFDNHSEEKINQSQAKTVILLAQQSQKLEINDEYIKQKINTIKEEFILNSKNKKISKNIKNFSMKNSPIKFKEKIEKLQKITQEFLKDNQATMSINQTNDNHQNYYIDTSGNDLNKCWSILNKKRLQRPLEQ